MREIKFRAWDHVANRWTDDRPYLEIETGQVYDVGRDGPGTNLTDRLALMQFTGLRDANGTEIYEGDIIKWEGFYPVVVRRYQIVWRDGHYLAHDLLDGALQNIRLLLELSSTRVIGNIHEHVKFLPPCERKRSRRLAHIYESPKLPTEEKDA